MLGVLMDDLHRHFDCGMSALLLLLDLTAAFDMVIYDLLTYHFPIWETGDFLAVAFFPPPKSRTEAGAWGRPFLAVVIGMWCATRSDSFPVIIQHL